jgi:hypothetical protein
VWAPILKFSTTEGVENPSPSGTGDAAPDDLCGGRLPAPPLPARSSRSSPEAAEMVLSVVLSRAVGAEQRDHLALADGEREALSDGSCRNRREAVNRSMARPLSAPEVGPMTRVVTRPACRQRSSRRGQHRDPVRYAHRRACCARSRECSAPDADSFEERHDRRLEGFIPAVGSSGRGRARPRARAISSRR